MVNVIDRIQNHAKKIALGEHEQIKPGASVAFTNACTNEDCIRQGDLYLIVVDSVPSEYIQVKKLTEQDKQLVPGNTQGSKHCLDSLDGVKLYRPKEWNEESLLGPCFISTEDRTVLHPVHGDCFVPAGLMIQCGYQKEWDKAQKAERRARD